MRQHLADAGGSRRSHALAVALEPAGEEDLERLRRRLIERTDRPPLELVDVRPALGFESLIETMFTLAAAGKTNRKGMPNPLRLAVIAKAHFDTVRLPAPPAFLQRAGLALAAPLGRLLGYEPRYGQASAKSTLASDDPRSPPPAAWRAAGRIAAPDRVAVSSRRGAVVEVNNAVAETAFVQQFELQADIVGEGALGVSVGAERRPE